MVSPAGAEFLDATSGETHGSATPAGEHVCPECGERFQTGAALGGHATMRHRTTVTGHGTTRYRAGCRCDECRAAIAAAMREFRRTRPDYNRLELKRRYWRTKLGDKACAVTACDRRARTKGWCGSHYQRWYKTGDPGTDPIADRYAEPKLAGVLTCVWCGTALRDHSILSVCRPDLEAV